MTSLTSLASTGRALDMTLRTIAAVVPSKIFLPPREPRIERCELPP